MLEKKQKRKYETNGKGKCQKNAQKNSVFGVVVKNKGVFLKMAFFREIGKHYLCSEGKQKTHIFVATICFGKLVLFCGHSKWQNTIKIGVSAGTGQNPKGHFWLQKCHFGKGPRKGLYYLWYLQAVFCWKHYVYSAFSKTQLCRHERVWLEKNQNLTKIGGWFARIQKGVFLSFFSFGVFLLCVSVLLLCLKNFPKLLFSCIFRGFLSILFPQKACLKLFLFFLFFFAFVFPFKNPFFSLRFVHQPRFRKDSLWGFFCFSFACLFLS